MGAEVWTDSIITWLGAAGILAYSVQIHTQRTRSNLEQKMLFLLYVLGTLFLIRGFAWLTGRTLLVVLTFVPATLLPIALSLFVEALLRRHAHLVLKVFVASGTALFFTWNLFAHADRTLFFQSFRIFALGTFAWLAVFLLARRRSELSPMENRFVNAFTAALAIGIFVAMTDVRIRPDWIPYRLGGIGGLIFVYVCVRATDLSETAWVILAEILVIGVKALVVTAAVVLLVGASARDWWEAAFFVFLAFALLHTILDRLRSLKIQNRRSSFFRWLLSAQTDSLDAFLESLHKLPIADHHLVLTASDLGGYEVSTLVQAFDEQPVWTVAALRTELSAAAANPLALEQLIDLLEQHDMTHVTLLNRKAGAFLLLSMPQVATAHNPIMEIALLHKYGRLIRAE